MAVFDPFDAQVGTKAYNPYFFYLIEHGSDLVLLDCGVHPAMRSDPRSRLGDAADAFDVRMTEDQDLASQLAKKGLRPSDITHVVQSHLHFDHAGGLELLAHAPVYVQEAERHFARNPPVYQRDIFVPADFEHDLDWHGLNGDHDLFGDGSIRIIATPGHTAGHQFLLADATYLLQKLRDRLLPAVVWSPDAMVASWQRIEELEREVGAELVCTHELDYEGRVPIAPGGWWE
jgi:glyoxylase-like metal-dependent hydrolase (beta-lactamase superfamily II)